MTTIGQRLTAEREAEIREVATYNPRPPLAPYLYEDLRVLLAELDATRAERDDAARALVIEQETSAMLLRERDEARRDEAYLIEKVALNAQQRDDAIHDLDEALKANKELNAALMKEAAAVAEARKDSARWLFVRRFFDLEGDCEEDGGGAWTSVIAVDEDALHRATCRPGTVWNLDELIDAALGGTA